VTLDRTGNPAAPWVGRFALIALIAGLLQGRPSGASGQEPEDRPNVLIVLTDDQRESGTLARMPAVRQWFRQGGVRYPQSFTPIPVCCPARASMMTGQYSHNHGVKTNRRGASGIGALQQETTMQSYLQEAGFRTGIFGKYLNRWDLDLDPPHFDDWAILNKGYHGAEFNVGGDARTVGYSTTFIERQALRFLNESESADQDPWLMYVTPFAPHWPARPKAAYEDAPVGSWGGNPAFFEGDRRDKPPHIQKRPPNESLHRARIRRARQLRSLMSVDDLVVALRRRLQQLDESKRTLAFFATDNGLLWGEHGWYSKDVPYSASIRIPLFMRWPGGGVEPNARDGRIVSVVDLAPTVFEAAGVDAGHTVDGRSLLDGSWTRPRALIEFWGLQSAAGIRVPIWASLRTGDYQYVEYYDAEGQVTFREYYDLTEDPWQLLNFLGDEDGGNDPPEGVQEELAQELAHDRGCQGTSGPPACP
jgi:arylsulfatase A-like enzyme